jgi:hypothetical protein
VNLNCCVSRLALGTLLRNDRAYAKEYGITRLSFTLDEIV